MKRYAVFAGVAYYPSGGWDDLHNLYESLEEAQKVYDQLGPDLKKNRWDDRWKQIVDLETGEEIRNNHDDQNQKRKP